MLGVSLIIIAAAIVYMVETYISTYYTIEYMHGTSLFLILLAKYGTPVLFLLLCAYIAYRNFLKKQKAAASAASERPTSKEELYTNKIQTALTPPTIEIVGFLGGAGWASLTSNMHGRFFSEPAFLFHKNSCPFVRIADNQK